MKKASPWPVAIKFLFRIVLRFRRLLPRNKCQAFGKSITREQTKIERIYVINLNRQKDRWIEMERELRHVLDWTGLTLWNLTERYSAFDATLLLQDSVIDADINPTYTLSDQLFVEPQPLALPTRMELETPIQMSHQEIAVARSHIGVWRQLEASSHKYVLVLEDDVWFRPQFTQDLNRAWAEIMVAGSLRDNFDILYLLICE